MKYSILFSLALVFASIVHAAEGKGPKTIDLGEISVNGELRKPSISWVDSQRPVKETLPGMFKMELDTFESKLLEPAPLKPAPQDKGAKNAKN